MRKAVPPAVYSIQLSSLASLVRTASVDKRIEPASQLVLLRAVDEITSILTKAQQKPLKP